jgi:hypothetical protein
MTGVSEEANTSRPVGIYGVASKGGWRTSRHGKGGTGTPKRLGRNPANRTIILLESVEVSQKGERAMARCEGSCATKDATFAFRGRAMD